MIPTTDALTEPTVMRQIRKLAKYCEENFDELAGISADGVKITDYETYFTLSILEQSTSVKLVDYETYFTLKVGE